MGVVNITPDSFSDGGQFLSPDSACDHIMRLVDDGADVIDLGAESSRPGAKLVSFETEWQRLEPVLNRLARRDLGARLSLDTNKPEIMRRAPDLGVEFINDIKGGADDDTLSYLASKGISYIAMHMHREPECMQAEPLQPQLAISLVRDFFAAAHNRLAGAGFANEKIWLDPGIGFGKSDAANLSLLQLSMSLASEHNLVVGISRKSFIGRLLDIESPVQRDAPSKMLELGLILAGVRVIRTHDVKRLDLIRQLLGEARL